MSGSKARHGTLESVGHVETRCRQEWRQGTQECVRHAGSVRHVAGIRKFKTPY